MSTLPQSQRRHLFFPSDPNDMALGEGFGLPQNYDHCLDLRMPTPAAEIHQYINQQYHIPVPAHLANIHNLGSWNLLNSQTVAEVLSTPCSLTVAIGGDSGYAPASYPQYGRSQNITHWGSYTACDPRGNMRSMLPDQHLSPSFANQGYRTLRHFQDQPNVHSPTQLNPHPTPTSFREAAPAHHLAFQCTPHRIFTGPSHYGHSAHVIEYNGLWIDEEELLKGLAEPDGKLIIHRCRWEEDRSPCQLWITCDKSQINAHIQRWHGGTPSGDKLEVDCRWSACGKRMLKGSIARHVLTAHFKETWKCQGCGKGIVRGDTYRQHIVESALDACRTSGALITYSADAREIGPRAALENGRRLQYTSI